MTIGIISKLLIITVITSVISCSGKPKQSRKPVSQIKIENKQNKLVLGDALLVSIKTKLHDGELDKTEIYIDDEIVDTKKELIFNSKIENISKVGKHIVKVVTSKIDGIEGVNYKSFEVLSDVIPEKFTYAVLKTIPHNEKYFTEGFEIHDGFLFESTGENGTSGIFKTNLQTSKLLQSVELDKQYFGEGITIFNKKIYQLTYKAKKGFIYDLESFAKIDSFIFTSEQGWGMTNDGKNLIMSDGTHQLTYLDPETLNVNNKLQVSNNKGIVPLINELEYSNGFIYANIYTTETIIKIDPSTGKVLAEIDLKGLLGTYNTTERIDVLNGIAIDSKTNKIYVTGKLWPKIFEIETVKKE